MGDPLASSSGSAPEREGGSPPVGDGLGEPQPFRARIGNDDPPELAAALEDLNSIARLALEAGYPIPSNAMLDATESMLRRLYGVAPYQYLVGSAPEGEIDIYARPKLAHSISVTLYADGEMLCSALAPNEEFFESFPSAKEVTDAVLLNAASVMKRALAQE